MIEEIEQYLKDRNDMSVDAKVQSWKASVKSARDSILSLVAAGNVGSSSSVSNPFAKIPATNLDNAARK